MAAGGGSNPAAAAQSAVIGSSGGLNLAMLGGIVTGEAHSSSFLCTTDLQRLPNNPCKFVVLSNWNASVEAAAPPAYDALGPGNLYENAGFEIYYGFDGIEAHQLFPSQMTPFFPISNTNQISVRVRNGAASRYVWFSWFN